MRQDDCIEEKEKAAQMWTAVADAHPSQDHIHNAASIG